MGGGALRTASLLHYLAQHRDVDLITFRHRPEQDPAGAIPPGLLRQVHVIDLPFHRKDALSRMARNTRRLLLNVPPLVDRFRGHAARIRELIGGTHYDIALIEHFWCAEYHTVLAGNADAVVLNLHNIESVLHETCASASPLWSVPAHKLFAGASARLERQWLPRFDELLVTSEEDAARARKLAPAVDICIYPNAAPLRPQPLIPDQPVVAFSGNLEYHPNQAAVEFFAHAIWPQLIARRPRLKWRLIGMNPEGIQGTISHLENVECTGAVPDAIEELARAQIVVVPLLSGSGTRLKIVEAWAAGRAVISTPLGAEGLPAHHQHNILVADSPELFISSIERLLDSPELRHDLGTAGRRTFEQELSWEAAWKRLEESRLAPRES